MPEKKTLERARADSRFLMYAPSAWPQSTPSVPGANRHQTQAGFSPRFNPENRQPQKWTQGRVLVTFYLFPL
jgi:hypothetical protein